LGVAFLWAWVFDPRSGVPSFLIPSASFVLSAFFTHATRLLFVGAGYLHSCSPGICDPPLSLSSLPGSTRGCGCRGGGGGTRGILAFDLACCDMSVIFEAHVRKRPTLFTGASGTRCRLFDFSLDAVLFVIRLPHRQGKSLRSLSFFCSGYFSFPLVSSALSVFSPHTPPSPEPKCQHILFFHAEHPHNCSLSAYKWPTGLRGVVADPTNPTQQRAQVRWVASSSDGPALVSPPYLPTPTPFPSHPPSIPLDPPPIIPRS
jgi:hypothetical protein